MLGKQVLHHMRRLGPLIDREARLAGIPVGHDGARLVGHPGVAAEPERRLNDRIRLSESLIGRAGVVLALNREIVAELGVYYGRRRIERRFRIGHWLTSVA